MHNIVHKCTGAHERCRYNNPLGVLCKHIEICYSAQVHMSGVGIIIH